MNAVNRIVVVLLLLLFLVSVALIAVAPEDSFRVAGGFLQWLEDSAKQYQRDHLALWATGRAVVGLLLVLIGLGALWLEVRRPRKRIIRAQKVAGGESFIAVESICQRVSYTLDQLPDVVSATPRVLGYGRGGLDLEIVLETTPEIDIPSKTDQVLQATREVVAERMGLKPGKVQVKIKHAPYPRQ